jgi:hypothetical protein
MNYSLKALAAIVLTSVLISVSACSTSADVAERTPVVSDPAAPAPGLPDYPNEPDAGTDAGIAWFALMSSDGEYAAAASYQAVIDAFGPVEPYVTIKEGEERHIEALIRQLERLGVEAPSNPYLGIIEAPADLETAARAWAEGEILNVKMYDELLAQTDNTNLVRVLTNLRRASLESHLPLFEAAAENGGVLTLEQMALIR